MRVVLDTNVLISALAFPGSKPDQILSRIRRGEIELFISPFILAELDRVLQDKFRSSRKEAQQQVSAVSHIAHLVQPERTVQLVTANDDDNRILECAIEARADFLVTGDKTHLLPIGSVENTQIVSPSDFLDILAVRSRDA